MKKRISSIALMTICALGGIQISGMLCTGGYAVTAHGKVIGFVEEAESVENITKSFDEEIKEEYGLNSVISEQIELVECADLKKNVSDEAELKKNISGLSDFMTEAYVLLVDGRETIPMKRYEDIISVLSKIKEKQMVEEGKNEILQRLEYKTDYVGKARVYGIDEALEYFEANELLSVKNTVHRNYMSAKSYDTIEIEDDTMYKGSVETVVEGEAGESMIYNETVYINGEKISDETIDEQIITPPVDEVVRIGTLTPPQGYGTGEFDIPVNGRLTSNFGQRWGRLHGGIDIAVGAGTPIGASDNGKVIFAGDCGSYGLLVKIDHNNGYVTYYAHCDSLKVSVGDCVEKGDIVAYSGNTGNSTGPHCHFEIRYNNEPLDPMNFLK